MKAFVTGSTGLLGSNLVELLIQEGHQVKVLARSAEKAKKQLGNLNVEVVVGDMDDVAAFAPHLASCDVLFHGAAYFREYYGGGADHWQTLERINIHGTIQLLNAAEAQGVGKVIYVSSSGVIGKTTSGVAGDESTAPDAEIMTNLYFRSKVVAEERITEWLKTHYLPVILILPTAMFGPRDSAPTAAGQIVIDFIHGELPAIPPGGFEVVDVRDVAQAMLTAVEKGRSGERYIINNRYATTAEILDILARVTGRPKPRIHMPYLMALGYAHVNEWIARLTGNTPLVTVAGVRTLHMRRPIIANKAKRELNFVPRPFEETLRDEVQWYLDNGYLKVKLSGFESAYSPS